MDRERIAVDIVDGASVDMDCIAEDDLRRDRKIDAWRVIVDCLKTHCRGVHQTLGGLDNESEAVRAGEIRRDRNCECRRVGNCRATPNRFCCDEPLAPRDRTRRHLRGTVEIQRTVRRDNCSDRCNGSNWLPAVQCGSHEGNILPQSGHTAQSVIPLCNNKGGNNFLRIPFRKMKRPRAQHDADVLRRE